MTKHVEGWLEQEGDGVEQIELAHSQLHWLQRELFNEYEPQTYVKFSDRVNDWLDNFADEADRRAMYLLLRHIFFVGREQMASLSRAAFDDVTCRWVIDRASIDLLDDKLQDKLMLALKRTWFCPVTDSMKINSFLKLNGLGGHEIRPDWLSLAQLGDPDKIRKFIEDAAIERIVMLEDFVGSGSQMSDAVQFALETVPGIPKLLVPLVCCPAGAQVGRNLAASRENLWFEPVLALREEFFVLREAQEGEPPEFAVARRLSAQMVNDFGTDWAHPFGHNETGALVVLHTN